MLAQSGPVKDMRSLRLGYDLEGYPPGINWLAKIEVKARRQRYGDVLWEVKHRWESGEETPGWGIAPAFDFYYYMRPQPDEWHVYDAEKLAPIAMNGPWLVRENPKPSVGNNGDRWWTSWVGVPLKAASAALIQRFAAGQPIQLGLEL